MQDVLEEPVRAEKLRIYRAEMQDFTAFLRQVYFRQANRNQDHSL